MSGGGGKPGLSLGHGETTWQGAADSATHPRLTASPRRQVLKLTVGPGEPLSLHSPALNLPEGMPKPWGQDTARRIPREGDLVMCANGWKIFGVAVFHTSFSKLVDLRTAPGALSLQPNDLPQG